MPDAAGRLTSCASSCGGCAFYTAFENFRFVNETFIGRSFPISMEILWMHVKNAFPFILLFFDRLLPLLVRFVIVSNHFLKRFLSTR